MKRFALIGLLVVAVLGGCGPSVGQTTARGISEFQVGRLEESKQFFQQVLSRYPSDPRALYYMGRISYTEGSYEMAMFYFQSSIDADPSFKDSKVWLTRAEKAVGSSAGDLRFIH